MRTYPLTLSFKLIAIAPQITLTDASGETVFYVRQKALALREDVRIFADDSQHVQLYQLNADRILDWSANYRVRTAGGQDVGSLKREGMRSMWKATYAVTDASGQPAGSLHEENPWIKLVDGLVGEIPFVGWVATMFINPSYVLERNGETVLRMKKEPAFFEGRFTIEKRAEMSDDEEPLLLVSLMMMVLLERQRG